MEIIRNAFMPGTLPSSKRESKWPFKNMNVGDMLKVPAEDCERARAYAHSYARSAKKHFATRRMDNGELHVYRIA